MPEPRCRSSSESPGLVFCIYSTSFGIANDLAFIATLQPEMTQHGGLPVRAVLTFLPVLRPLVSRGGARPCPFCPIDVSLPPNESILDPSVTTSPYPRSRTFRPSRTRR